MIIKHYKSDPDELAVKEAADAFGASSRHSFVTITDGSCLSAAVANNRGSVAMSPVPFCSLFSLLCVNCTVGPVSVSGDSQSQLIVFLVQPVNQSACTHARTCTHCTVEVIKKQWGLLKWALFMISQCISACDIQYNYYWGVLLLFWCLCSVLLVFNHWHGGFLLWNSDFCDCSHKTLLFS